MLDFELLGRLGYFGKTLHVLLKIFFRLIRSTNVVIKFCICIYKLWKHQIPVYLIHYTVDLFCGQFLLESKGSFSYDSGYQLLIHYGNLYHLCFLVHQLVS